jgi:hypothetical protein
MAQLLFYADSRDLYKLEPGESPKNSFVCMHGLGIHIDARAQLYSIVMGEFLQDALAMEELVDDLGTEASWISRLHGDLVERLGELDERAIAETVTHWMLCEEMESLQISRDDLLEYMFTLVNLCLSAHQEDACVYTFTSF